MCVDGEDRRGVNREKISKLVKLGNKNTMKGSDVSGYVFHRENDPFTHRLTLKKVLMFQKKGCFVL